MAWCDFQPRTEALAEALGGEAYFVKGGALRRRRWLLPLRYLRDAIETWQALEQRQPATVVVVSPPVFAPLTAWAWCRAGRAKLVMDFHTPAFRSRKWAWSRPLHRVLARRADAVTLHSENARLEVAAWGAPAVFVPDDLPDDLPDAGAGAGAAAASDRGRPRLLMAGSLDELEPVEAEIEAARLVPQVEVIFTGDTGRLPRRAREDPPPNAVFTGRLPYPEFLEQCRAADVVAAFCTDPLAVNRAAFEALAFSRPLVLSELPSVRERFGEAALFCPNEPAAMAATIRQALTERTALTERSANLQAKLRKEREHGLRRLQDLLDGSPPSRLLMISQHDYPSHPILRRNVDFLADCGVEVDVVCSSDKRISSAEVRAGPRLHRVRLQHRRLGPIWYLVEYVVFLLRALPRVCWLASRARYDTVQVDNLPDLLILAGLPARRRGARLVFFMHELMPELTAARLEAVDRHPIVRVLRRVERFAISCADAVIIVNEPCRRILVDRGAPEDKVTVVLNTPPSRQGPPRSGPPTDPVMITHATLIERYGVQIAIEALGHLAHRWPSLTLEVLGTGEHRQALERLARRLGLQDRVHFRGYLPWDEVLERVRRASVGVVPVIGDGYGHLLLPTKLFDYVSQGLPAVSSRLATVAEYFPDDSVSYFEAGDALGLAERVDALLADPARAARQAARALEVYDGMRWERESHIYLQVLGLPGPAKVPYAGQGAAHA